MTACEQELIDKATSVIRQVCEPCIVDSSGSYPYIPVACRNDSVSDPPIDMPPADMPHVPRLFETERDLLVAFADGG